MTVNTQTPVFNLEEGKARMRISVSFRGLPPLTQPLVLEEEPVLIWAHIALPGPTL